MKQISFKQYRRIDLTLWCVLAAVFEALAAFATNYWFAAQPMAISLTLTFVCIVMMRWNAYAFLPCLTGSLAYCIACGLVAKQTLWHYFIYCVGSLACLLALPVLLRLGKEGVRKNFTKRMLFVTVAYLLTVVGRWLCSLPSELTLATLPVYLTTDVLSLLFALFALSFAANADGVLEDQKLYLLRLERERQENAESGDENGY